MFLFYKNEKHISILFNIFDRFLNDLKPKKEDFGDEKLQDNYSKDNWFASFKNLDIQSWANIVSYTINCLFVEEKWNSLTMISREFCNVTQHHFSGYVLPFLIYSQGIKHESAKKKTEEKKEEKRIRTEEFEKWKVFFFFF
jgi:hypothetical protein